MLSAAAALCFICRPVEQFILGFGIFSVQLLMSESKELFFSLTDLHSELTEVNTHIITVVLQLQESNGAAETAVFGSMDAAAAG